MEPVTDAGEYTITVSKPSWYFQDNGHGTRHDEHILRHILGVHDCIRIQPEHGDFGKCIELMLAMERDVSVDGLVTP